MPDAVLDDPGFLAVRERFWTTALTDERYRENRVAVAERHGPYTGRALQPTRGRDRPGRPILEPGREIHLHLNGTPGQLAALLRRAAEAK